MFLQELSRSNFVSALKEAERVHSQLNRLFENFNAGTNWNAEFPQLNIWTGENSATLTAMLPGLNADDLDISIVNDVMTLRGYRDSDHIQEGTKLHRKERNFGQFTRTIQLPFRMDMEKVEAQFKNGILTILLPRAEQDKPRKITVNA